MWYDFIMLLFALTGLAASLIGFGVSLYIRQKKKSGTPLACPRKMDCSTVTSGKYSTFFGVPNETLGIVYYKIFSIVFFIMTVGGTISLMPLRVIAGVGMLFSIYLVVVQAVVLRAWCGWCLVSVACAAALFTVAMLI